MATAPSLIGSSTTSYNPTPATGATPFGRTIQNLQEKVNLNVLEPATLQYLHQNVQHVALTSMKIYMDKIAKDCFVTMAEGFSEGLDQLIKLSEEIARKNLHAREGVQLISEMKKAAKKPPTFNRSFFESKIADLDNEGADPTLTASLIAKLDEFELKAQRANTPSLRALALANEFLEASSHPETFSPDYFVAEIAALEAQKANPAAIGILRDALRLVTNGPAGMKPQPPAASTPEATPYVSAGEEEETEMKEPLMPPSHSDITILVEMLRLHRTDAQAAMNQIQSLSPIVYNNIDKAQADPVIREREIQRTLVWTLLTLIRGNLSEQSKINEYLDHLDKMKLDARDLPSGKKNLAHYLYERLYYTYKAEAEKSGSGLLHPHDGVFKGDFGRVAFRGEAGTLDRRFLDITLEEVYKEIVDTLWKSPQQ